MIVDEFIEQLRALDPPVFSLVEGIGELASLQDAPAATPAGYVFIKEEAGGENKRITGLLQRVEADIGVVIVMQNVSDNAGGAAMADIEAIKLKTIGAIAGTQPASAADTVEYAGGQLVRARNGYVWWELTFSAPYLLESKP